MLTQLSLNQVPHVIALAMAPAFLLGAVVGFSALLVGKMTSVVTRLALHAIEDGDRTRAHLKADIPRLRRCARLISRSLVFAIALPILPLALTIVPLDQLVKHLLSFLL